MKVDPRRVPARTAGSNYRVTEPIETNWTLSGDGGHGGRGYERGEGWP